MVERRLLDTDVLSAFFRNHPRVLARAADYLLEHAHLSISIMTYYKVLRGLRYVNAVRQLSDLTRFVADNEILPLDVVAVQRAADVYVALRRQGEPIGDGDVIIAGIALANESVLVTNNTEHFARVPGLKIENWLA